MLNPVFRKDMRVLFRNAKAYIGLTIYLVVLALIAGAVLKMINYNTYNGFNPEYIIQAYLGMFGFQMVAITFIVPAFTSNSISGERERQTLDFMLITRMSSWDIVFGKLLSSVVMVALMIIASMPIYAIIFYYGGISIIGFIFNILFLIVYAAFIGSISVLFSTIFKKTAAATAISNLFVLGLSIGTFTLTMFIVGISQIYDWPDFAMKIVAVVCIGIMSLNPVVSFVSIIDSQMGSEMVWNAVVEMLDLSAVPDFIQVWHIIAVVYILMSYLLLKISAKNIIPLKRVRKKYNK